MGQRRDAIVPALCAFVLKASTQRVAIVFDRTPTLETRLQLTDELVMTVLPKRERQDGGHDAPIVIEWRAIQKEFRELMETRNHLAHWPVVKGASVKIATNPSTLDMEITSYEDTLEMSQSLTELHRGMGKKDRIKPTDLPGHHSRVIALKNTLNQFYYKLSGELPPGRFALPPQP
jgi:hypothetical protein